MDNAIIRHPWVSVLALYLTCVAAATATELVAALSGSRLAIWLPAGLVLAVMIVTPMSKWALWSAAAIAAEVTGNIVWYGHLWGPALLLTLGNTLAALTGAATIRYYLKGTYILDDVRHAGLFTVVAIILMPTISATIGSIALGWSYSKAPFDAWTRLMLGDATGIILAAPLALLFLKAAAPATRFPYRRKMEAALLMLVFAAMAAVSLGGILPFAFLMFPLSLWSALSFRMAGAVISSAALTMLTVAFTFAGASPFAENTISPDFQFTGLQLFILVASTTALLIGAVAEEKRQWIRQLSAANLMLEERDAERTVRLASTEARARETESLLSAISEACPDLIYAKNRQLELVYANDATLKVLGADDMDDLLLKGELPYYQNVGEFDVIRQNDEHVIASEQMLIVEESLTNAVGETSIYRSTKAPLFDSDGNISGLAGVSVDITEMKKAQTREKMLVREVDHRSRNVLAVVHGLVQLTRAETVSELKDKLGKRIGALARTNGAIAASNWQGASLIRILHEELAPYQDDQDQRVFLTGEEIQLDPATAQSITLVLHELTTNAAKYGALSSRSGCVQIDWVRRDAPGQFSYIDLKWFETGGPPVTAPARQGFGSVVIASFGEDREEAGVHLDWKPEGLVATLAIAVPKAISPLSTAV